MAKLSGLTDIMFYGICESEIGGRIGWSVLLQDLLWGCSQMLAGFAGFSPWRPLHRLPEFAISRPRWKRQCYLCSSLPSLLSRYTFGHTGQFCLEWDSTKAHISGGEGYWRPSWRLWQSLPLLLFKSPHVFRGNFSSLSGSYKVFFLLLLFFNFT